MKRFPFRPLLSLNILVLLLSLSLFTSCFEEDEMVSVHVPGDIKTAVLELGEKYTTQIYYDLAVQDFVSTNSIEAWDLAFQCGENEWRIFMNSAKNMHAGNTGVNVFEAIIGDPGVTLTFDKSDGDPDSTAIGDWYEVKDELPVSKNEVYIIDRGLDETLVKIGKKKVVFERKGESYIVRYAELDGENEQSMEITKDDKYNFVFFSFDDGVKEVEPEKDKWSLLFTKYSTILFTTTGLPYPYSVTGALLNPNQVSAALDTNDFESISLEDTINYTFHTEADYIGYDWKYYSLDDDVYLVEPNRNYIIQDHDKRYYKMRIIDFYNQNGERGTITIETVRL